MSRSLILFLILIFIEGCVHSEVEIPDTWEFTILNKSLEYEKGSFPLQSDHTFVIVYYPEICGFCLSQIDMLMKQLSVINPERKKKNTHLLCVIRTKNIVTMQYYLDEKLEYVSRIYIDHKGFINDYFFSNKKLEYPCYFIVKGKKVLMQHELNDNNSLNQLFSVFIY